ncbi:MAG: VOC family protein [Gammaproteobacteria bacterium]
MHKPNPVNGMRHVALFTINYEACENFYVEVIGMKVEWRPDDDNVYLSSGNDNIALHRIAEGVDATGPQRLDHIGFILGHSGEVDKWYDYMLTYDVRMKTAPRTHRDGARSFYCYDPDGNTVQMIYHPPIADKC